MSDPKLTQISGIGPATADVLTSNGFDSVQAIANATVAALSRVPGFGPARAAVVIGAAKAALSVPEASEPTPSAKKDGKTKKKKDKKGKKGKGKKKKDKKGKKGKGKQKKKKKK